MPEYFYTVRVITDTEEHADQVMRERIGPDEDYGFEYSIDYGHRTKTGKFLNNADFEKLADEAEQGYDH